MDPLSHRSAWFQAQIPRPHLAVLLLERERGAVNLAFRMAAAVGMENLILCDSLETLPPLSLEENSMPTYARVKIVCACTFTYCEHHSRTLIRSSAVP